LDNSIAKHELEEFFKNIQNVLKKHSLQELNQSVNDFIANSYKNTRCSPKKIDIVLKVVCEEFDITKDKLIVGRGKGLVQEARKYAFVLLHQELNLTIRYIAKYVFHSKWHTSVAMAIKYYKNINLEVKPDKEFNSKFKELQTKIKAKLTND
jgi:chromosomal replication initiation ATPase DnaA